MSKQNSKRTKANKQSKQAKSRMTMARPKPLDPYLSCFLSSTNSSVSAFRGVPNAYSGGTVKVEHTMTINFKPDSDGRIVFAILPSPLGGIAVLKGKFTATYFDTNTNSWQAGNWDTGAASWNGQRYAVLPFTEYCRGDPRTGSSTGQNSSTFASDQFTLGASKARITYAGDDYYNSGMVYVGRQVIKILDTNIELTTVPAGISAGTLYQISDAGPQTADDVSKLPDFTMMRVSQPGGIEVNNVQLGLAEMQPFKEGFIPTDSNAPGNVSDCPFSQLGYDGAISKNAALANPGWANMTTTFVWIEGMNTTTPQPITVTCKNCVEYAVTGKSSVARFATSSPKVSNPSLNAVVDAGKLMPAAMSGVEADHCGWICKAGKAVGYAGQFASSAAEYLPYVGQFWKGSKALYGAFNAMGGGNALTGAARYAIGF